MQCESADAGMKQGGFNNESRSIKPRRREVQVEPCKPPSPASGQSPPACGSQLERYVTHLVVAAGVSLRPSCADDLSRCWISAAVITPCIACAAARHAKCLLVWPSCMICNGGGFVMFDAVLLMFVWCVWAFFVNALVEF